MPSPRPRAWRGAWLGASLCAALTIACPENAMADEPVPLSMVNRALTQHEAPPGLLGGAVLTISGAVVAVGGLIGALAGSTCYSSCGGDDRPNAAGFAIAAVGAVGTVLGLALVLPLQVRARRKWLREHGLRFSGRPGGGALGFEGRF